MRRRLLLVPVLALLGTAVPSFAGTTTGVVKPLLHALQLPAGDHLEVVRPGERALGLTWTRGGAAPTTALRWHVRASGHTAAGWAAWSTPEVDTGDDSTPGALPGTAPAWVPPGADLVELRTSRPLRLVTVLDGVLHRVHTAVASASEGTALLGTVESRAAWGADESMRKGHPSYASTVRAVVVHHTDNTNGYSPSDVPALIRADYAYHVQGRGWSDLGYNLLVDQFGRIWEGRAGGLGRATIGAHAEGFNTGTLGVSMIGDMTHATASAAAQKALARVIAYAATTWHFDPKGTVTLTSGGSPRFAAGRKVTLHRVFGHEETGRTACPGSLEDALPHLRDLAATAMLPAPSIRSLSLTGVPVHAPTPVVLDARLDRADPWTAELLDPQGKVVVSAHSGTAAPHLSWDGEQDTALGRLPAAPGTYSYQLRVDDGYHPVVSRTGTFQVAGLLG